VRALKEALGSIGLKAGSRLGVDTARMEAFLIRLKEFIDNARGLVRTDYSVALRPELTGIVDLLPTQVLAGSASDSSVNRFLVDLDLRLIQQQKVSLSEVETAERSEQEGGLEVVITTAGLARVFVRGVLVGVWESSNTVTRRQPNQWARPMVQFDQILRDHIESKVVAERGFRYWADRHNRTLLRGADGTERIFQHQLFWWLENFVSDAIDVKAESRGMGQDPTDMTVVTPWGHHVVEVKWLGRNEASTEFKHPPRIDQGLEQVSLYLDRDPRLIGGHLVVYDARPQAEHQASSKHNEQFRHKKCPHPHLVFLESGTPSEIAKERVGAVTGKGVSGIKTKSAVKKATLKQVTTVVGKTASREATRNSTKKVTSKQQTSLISRGKKGKTR
jgi:hypothetical protein